MEGGGKTAGKNTQHRNGPEWNAHFSKRRRRRVKILSLEIPLFFPLKPISARYRALVRPNPARDFSSVSSLPHLPAYVRNASLHEVGAALSDLSKTTAARWFAEEIRPHEPALRAYLRGRFSGLFDVDDIVQETYARLFRARDSGKTQLTRAYLFVIARNVALDLVRHQQAVAIDRLTDIEHLSVAEDRPCAAETISRGQELELLADAIRALPPRCGEIVTLRRIEGLSHREIARRLGITENTVNAQLAIGLIRCRKYLCCHGVSKACLHASSNTE